MKTPKFWSNLNPISIGLYPVSLLYGIVSRIRFYLQTPYKFKTKIICVGNVNVGGSGKTPSAIAIGKLLQKNGYKIAYACKNYLGSISAPTMVSGKFTSTEVLDEALLLSKIAPTFVAKDRRKSIEMAAKSRADFVIVDDGLQNNTFHKDISILVINEAIGVGNGFLLPAGPLREPLKRGVRRADVIFNITDSSMVIPKNIESPITFSIKQLSLSKQPKNVNYIAFSGIAYPVKFFDTLLKNGFSLIDKLEYPDHHNYSQKEIEHLISKAWKIGARLITTEKDLVRIDTKYHKHIDCFKIKLEIKNKERLLKIIEAL